MSHTRSITLWCDAEGCTDWTGDTEASVHMARLAASRIGWVQVKGEDRCPRHGGKPGRATFEYRMNNSDLDDLAAPGVMPPPRTADTT